MSSAELKFQSGRLSPSSLTFPFLQLSVFVFSFCLPVTSGEQIRDREQSQWKEVTHVCVSFFFFFLSSSLVTFPLVSITQRKHLTYPALECNQVLLLKCSSVLWSLSSLSTWPFTKSIQLFFSIILREFKHGWAVLSNSDIRGRCICRTMMA